MDIGRSPIEPLGREHEEELFEEAYEIGGHGKSGGELLGNSAIPPTLYHCPEHGDVLAQDVVWKQDGRPYCPECGAALGSDRD
jgi:hypothetical protein